MFPFCLSIIQSKLWVLSSSGLECPHPYRMASFSPIGLSWSGFAYYLRLSSVDGLYSWYPELPGVSTAVSTSFSISYPSSSRKQFLAFQDFWHLMEATLTPQLIFCMSTKPELSGWYQSLPSIQIVPKGPGILTAKVPQCLRVLKQIPQYQFPTKEPKALSYYLRYFQTI